MLPFAEVYAGRGFGGLNPPFLEKFFNLQGVFKKIIPNPSPPQFSRPYKKNRYFFRYTPDHSTHLPKIFHIDKLEKKNF